MIHQKTLILPVLGILICGLIPVARATDPAAERAKVYSGYDLLTGQYWKSSGDPRHPAVPPRLVAVTTPQSLLHPSRILFLKAGDSVSVRSGAADSRITLMATALGGGAPGDDVQVRIHVTGAVVKVRIVDATSAVLTGPIRGDQ